MENERRGEIVGEKRKGKGILNGKNRQSRKQRQKELNKRKKERTKYW